FPPPAVRAWFEAEGVPMKCEDDLRVFPISNNGHDIVNTFTKIFSDTKTEILLNHSVTGVKKISDGFVVELKNQEPINVDRVILTLGGQAYRQTGSTGDGYSLAESLGHHITKLAPSLNSFIIQEKWAKELAGVSFANATITASPRLGGVGVGSTMLTNPSLPSPRRESSGPFLFTHTGISGPAVFALSSLIAFEDYGLKKPMSITIDLLPDISNETLLFELKQAMNLSPKKTLKNTVRNFVPLSVAEVICMLAEVPPEKKNAETGKQMVGAVLKLLKQLPLTINGRGSGDEFVTAGGVELTEVDPRTMESKLTPDLFFAGEILNIDGFTGGFNLQASWATGKAAGVGAGS
ncbi:MAG: aminoacetone oxidase family FAD-binding enzyme, partial [Patescibacteria group bacterium]